MSTSSHSRAKMSSIKFQGSSSLLSFPLLLMIHVQFGVVQVQAEAASQVYIVYMGARQHEDPILVTASHHELLASVLGRHVVAAAELGCFDSEASIKPTLLDHVPASIAKLKTTSIHLELRHSKEAAAESILYSYKHGFSGFSAILTESHAKQISEIPGVIRVTPSRSCEVQTTRSWDFLGLSYSPPSEILGKSNQGDGVIIGVVDSGVWPESRSFNDRGYGPIPSRWKGICEKGEAFNESHCNRKIIGARWYARGVSTEDLGGEYLSPRDMNGHGTGTASIAAGSVVSNVSFEGLARGMARGGAPRARLAIYKVLWGRRPAGSSAALLAAIDDAIHDGVDILSLSLSNELDDGSFVSLHAVEKGITVVFAAGNDGPRPQSLGNTAPWVITVAATTIDRSFTTPITLGNNVSFTGQSTIGSPRQNEFQPLVFLPNNPNCERPLNATQVTRKVVLCFTGDRNPVQFFSVAASRVTQAGGVGLIFAQYANHISQSCQNISCMMVDYQIGLQILDYIGAARNPTVKMGFTTTVVGSFVLAPKVASFSSRGPNQYRQEILKPDVAAPGVSILAAYLDTYAFLSGTSFSCPHVAGIVALTKSLHPEWSPAAIKSALVTTASTFDEFGSPIMAEGVPRKIADPFDHGGGHVNPNRAVDPGLIYDIDAADYSKWDQGSIPDLNLPSISIPDLRTTKTVARTVTNVGPINATYTARLQSPPGVRAVVTPSVLNFNATAVKRTFQITFIARRRVQGDFTFGSLIWSNNQHIVRIPIAVKIVIEDLYADVF